MRITGQGAVYVRTVERLTEGENSDEETNLPVGNATLPSIWAETSRQPGQRLDAEAHVQSDMQGRHQITFDFLQQLIRLDCGTRIQILCNFKLTQSKK